MKNITETILTPFRKVPLGYYRLFIATWILFPSIVAIIIYATISGSNTLWRFYDAFDVALKWFVVLFIVYYPFARIILWTVSGFLKESNIGIKSKNEIEKITERNNQEIKDLKSEYQSKILNLKTKHDNEIEQLNAQIQKNHSDIRLLQSKTEITNRAIKSIEIADVKVLGTTKTFNILEVALDNGEIGLVDRSLFEKYIVEGKIALLNGSFYFHDNFVVNDTGQWICKQDWSVFYRYIGNKYF